MPSARQPDNEAARLEKVKSFHILDTLAEEAFDDLTRFAAKLCGMPVSLISLIDENRQWFKSAIGMEKPENPREETVCQHTILQDDLLEIEDSRFDWRTEDNPNVTVTPGVRHYAGIPLHTEDGFNIGTFCVVDFKPGKLTELQREGLKTLAAQAMRLMEFRKLSYQYEEARQLAESANRAKSDFLAVMSHEIRTPLNGMIGMVSILKETNLSKEQQRFLGIIERSGAMLMNVIGNVLDFSKLQAEAMERSETTFDLGETLNEVFDLFSARAAEKNIDLTLAVAPQIPRLIVTDQTKFRQIVMNLVSNALKFTQKGGVTIRAALAHEPGREKRLEVAVEDTGIGMSDAQRAKLFQPFSQADGSISRRFGGTGLGLSIAKKLTELLGGTIGVKSQEGKGSTFFFSIPARFDLEREAVELARGHNLAGRKILVVDNLTVNLEIVQHMLESLKTEVTACAEPKAAVELARKSRFDAAILDLNMPGMNGIEIAEILKTISPQTIRILLSSVAVTRNFETEHLFHYALTKPVRREQLAYALWRLLSERQPQAEPAAQRKILAGKRILIVEDDSINQTISRLTIEKFGGSSDTAPDGEAALALVGQQDYALVLLDIHLPDIDGFDLAPKLLKIRPSLKLVAFTADITLIPEGRLKQAGIIDKLSKPATLNDFHDFLSKASWL